MKKLTSILLFVLIVFAFQFPFAPRTLAQDQEQAKEFAPPGGFDRTYWKAKDESGAEIWLVWRADGGMELYGRDAASTYEGIIVRGEDPKTVECHGRGFRFVDGVAFTYRSTLTEVKEDGKDALHEKWEAITVTGEVIKGEATLFALTEEG